MSEVIDGQIIGEAVNRRDLYRKLSAVMADVQYIQKDAENKFHGYSYASEAAIKAALHKAFVKHGVVFLLAVLDVQEREAAPTKSGKTQWITRAILEYEFTDADTGYSITKTFAGQGIDGEDKGLYKAITGGLKYALTSAFLIETGMDPEGETDQGQRVNAARLRSIERVAEGVGKGAKGYDKKKAANSILRERDRLYERAGAERGGWILALVLKEHGWVTIDDDAKVSDPIAARAMFKAIAAAVVEAGDEQSDANPDPAKRKSEPKGKAGLPLLPYAPKQQAGKFAYLEEFQEAKKEHGEASYYKALSALGWEKSNQIPVEQRATVLAALKKELQMEGAPME